MKSWAPAWNPRGQSNRLVRPTCGRNSYGTDDRPGHQVREKKFQDV